MDLPDAVGRKPEDRRDGVLLPGEGDRHGRRDHGLIVVRPAALEDLPALGRIYRDASLSNDGDRDALLADPSVLVYAGDAVRAGRTSVAEIDGRVVGFASVIASVEGVLELEDLFTDPPYMRRGVATALLAALGHAPVEVTANPHALAFYAAVGFVEVGPVQTELGPGVRMVRDGSPAP